MKFSKVGFTLFVCVTLGVGFGSGCSSQGKDLAPPSSPVDSKSSSAVNVSDPELTEQIIQKIADEAYRAAMDGDIQLWKASTCRAEVEPTLESMKQMSQTQDEDELGKIMPPEDKYKPRNVKLLGISEVESADGKGSAVIHSVEETPKAGGDGYKKMEYKNRHAFVFEDGRWKVCGTLDIVIEKSEDVN